MVKPQSSKLITRVRFPSSPPLQRLRRKRRGLFRCWDDGNPFRMRICFLARSESARSSSSSPRTIPPTLSGGFFVLGDDGNRLRAKIHSLARSESARSSPSSPPIERHFGYKDFRSGREGAEVAFSLFWGGFRGIGLEPAELRSGSQCGLIGWSEWCLRGSLGPSKPETSKNTAPRQKVSSKRQKA